MSWTKFTTAMPTGPFYAWCPSCDGIGSNVWLDGSAAIECGYTHWHPAPPLPEPPREETQGERDEAAFNDWFSPFFGAPPHDYSVGQRPAWHAALAWERGEVAKIIARIYEEGGLSGSYTDWVKAIVAIRQRVGGAK